MNRLMQRSPFITTLLLTAIMIFPLYAGAAPLDIGSRLEPMIDDYLIDDMDGVELRLHKPIARNISFTTDKPWEGNTSCYFTVFEDDGLYRMYFRGSNFDVATKTYGEEYVCYAESTDGINFTRPDLNIVEFKGSKANNIILEGIGSHNFSPFKDMNPNCKPSEKYKALARGEKKNGLIAFTSPDAIHWTMVSEKSIITKGAFDSQNLAFYDEVRGRYVEFHRGFQDGFRAIMTCTSEDFKTWTEPEWVSYENKSPEHLYTNATIAYPRAPHIFMAFPKRFMPKRNSGVHPITGISDGVFMTSRDGNKWKRWREALIRPGLQDSRWVNRNNMTAWGMLQTPGTLPNTPDEFSLYSTEGYYVGPCHLHRYSIRQDGFVSMHAGGKQGEFLTKPIVFSDDPEVTGTSEKPSKIFLTDAAIHGKQALRFDSPEIITLPNTQSLGKKVTFAAVVRDVPKGTRRLFSAYNGGSVKTEKGELWIDFNSNGKEGSLRFGGFGELIEAKAGSIADWSKNSGNKDSHLLAVTWDDGVVKLYFDGKLVGEGGTAGRGAITLDLGNVRFGEDYPPTPITNEPFIGTVDDIIILRQTLSAEAIATLAAKGAENIKGGKGDLLIDFETLRAGKAVNVFNADDSIRLPGYQAAADTTLNLNFSTSAAGSIRCEIQDENGTPIPGFTLKESDELFGDAIGRTMTWEGRTEVNNLVGKTIRLRFVMKDADLYSLRFR